MLKRRELLKYSGLGLIAGVLPRFASGAKDIRAAMNSSDLIYVTPIKSNGEESRCQSEIWFVNDGTDMFVCTGSDSWRARAARKGVDRARIWVGDVGNWQRARPLYKQLPKVEARATIIEDKARQNEILALFGKKYPDEWDTYGPRFRNGLANGGRTMIRYRPLS